MILPGVPVVITFVVRIVIGVFMPALLVTPARTQACMPEISFHLIMAKRHATLIPDLG